MLGMARAATTADAFNAVAEPRRRDILDLLAGGERPVNDLVQRLGLAQPQVSKHLRVLRAVGAVDVRDVGRQRLYRVNGPARPWAEALRAAGKDVTVHEFPNVDHAFHNDTSAARYNRDAAEGAWAETLAFFGRHLR